MRIVYNTFKGRTVLFCPVHNGAGLSREELIESIVDSAKDGEFKDYGIVADRPVTVRLNACEKHAVIIQHK